MGTGNNTLLHLLQQQLSHVLEKLWRVFSWCSSILISITAAVLTAARFRENSLLKFPADQLLISGLILIITVYAWLWLNENLKFETVIRKQMEELVEKEMNYPVFKNLRPDKKARFGYKDVVILLGLTALLATWMA